jgi:hypothetical protein
MSLIIFNKIIPFPPKNVGTDFALNQGIMMTNIYERKEVEVRSTPSIREIKGVATRGEVRKTLKNSEEVI